MLPSQLNNSLENYRLITASLAVLETVHNGQLFANSDVATAGNVEAFQNLQIAVDAAIHALPKTVSPFLRYRIEVMEESLYGEMLRGLVLHMVADAGFQYLSMHALLKCMDSIHTRIAMEMIEAFSKIGPDDRDLRSLAQQIRLSLSALPAAA